jgi:hypothetical protein
VLLGYQIFTVEGGLIDPEIEDKVIHVNGSGIYEEYDEDEDEPRLIEPDDINYVDHVRTKMLDIGQTACAQLTNLPLIQDNNGILHQLTEPAFVSMQVTQFDDLSYLDNRTIRMNSADTTQLIFRLPFHEEGSAVFQGYNLDEASRIDGDPSLLRSAKKLLLCIRNIFREDLMIMTCNRGRDQNGMDVELDFLEEYAILSLPIRPLGVSAMLFAHSEDSRN